VKIHKIYILEERVLEIAIRKEKDPDNFRLSRDDEVHINNLLSFFKDPHAYLKRQFKTEFDNLALEFTVGVKEDFQDNFKC